MLDHPSQIGLDWIMGGLCLLIVSLHGCSVVGPSTISRGRADYNEAIERTDSEQILMTIVRNRYGETFSMLAVTGITANVRIVADASGNVGIGPSEDYTGNLVPFSGGFSYEENPTISYAPVQGAQYLRELLSPLPLDLLVLLTRSVPRPELALTLLTSSVNAIRNLAFQHPPSAPDPRFARLGELIAQLGKAGHLVWVEDPQKKGEFAIVIRGYTPTHVREVDEFLTLLGLPMPTDQARDLVLPLSLTLQAKEVGGIAITTRSAYDLITLFSASIAVPEQHAHSGLAVTYPSTGLAGRHLSIRTSNRRPQTASVAVKYRGVWFYIDETDQATKLMFRLVKAIWAVSIAGATKHLQAAPLLTVPASN